MSRRAVIVGLLGAAFVAGVTYFNDNIMRQTLLIGNHMPHSVYGGLLLFLLLVNPALALLRRRWAFTGGEIAVVLALTLSACAIPGAGLMRFFTNAVMLPHQKARTRPAWQAEDVVDMLPEYMLAGTPAEFDRHDIEDARAWAAQFVQDADAGALSQAQRRVRDTLAPEQSGAILDASVGRVAPSAVLVALNSLLDRRGLYDASAFASTTLPAEATRLLRRELKLAAAAEGREPPDDLSVRPSEIRYLDANGVRWLNRHLIDATWPDSIRSISSRRYEELQTFRFGMARQRRPVGPHRVPWSAWVRPLAFWLPLVLVMSAGVLGLAVVVHKQWSEHEHLPYPIGRFALALLPANGHRRSRALRSPMFLWTAAVILSIHLLNYTHTWWPRYFVRVPTVFDISSLQVLVPAMGGPVARWAIFTVRIYFVAVGIAFFVATDVALAIGIAAPLSTYVNGVLSHYGISISRRGLYSGSPGQTFHVGAYSGFLLMLLYTGRRFYASVLRRAFGLRATDPVTPEVVWGARVFLLCAAVFALYLVAAGVPWPLAILYTVLAFTLFVVMSRIVAETGLFFMEPRWYACAFLVAVFGARAVGPTTALVMFMFSTILMVVPRESLMPFVVNAFKVVGDRGVRVGRTAVWCGVAVVVALVVAVPVTLMFQYGAGTHHWDTWGTGAVPRYSFDKTVELKQKLRAQGVLEEAETAGGLARLRNIMPDTPALIGFAVGLSLVLLLAGARLRLPWWPLHPVLAIAFWSYPGSMFWPSFLLGWAIKKAVVRYGGQKLYRRLTPLMLGLIAGDVLGMLVPSLIGALYYLATGRGAPVFIILPD